RAAYVDVLERTSVRDERGAQFGGRRGRVPQRVERGDLRADVHVDGDELQHRPPYDRLQQRRRVLERQSELVDPEAGGNVRVAAGVDVRVDSHRHACRNADLGGDGFDAR